MALVLFGITGSEQEIVSESAIKIQENVFLTGFMLSSVVYESFTMTLTLQARSKQVITHGESWVNWKIAILVVVLLVSSVQLSMLMYLNMYKAKILMKNFWVVINYLAFFLHLAYSSSFYWDLKQISFTINFSQEDSEEHSLNSSTF